MKMTDVGLGGVRLIEPRVFADDRGFFTETFHGPRYADAGLPSVFVQDNWSRSIKGTLRGLHFQEPHPQGKLVMVARGTIWDVVVDIRQGSATFGKWYGVELSDANHCQLWVPPGFAHGFCALSDVADVLYKCTNVYVPEADAGIAWNDPALGIAWPVANPLLSPKDAAAPHLKDAPRLPRV